jgi:hypothetical protein
MINPDEMKQRIRNSDITRDRRGKRWGITDMGQSFDKELRDTSKANPHERGVTTGWL